MDYKKSFEKLCDWLVELHDNFELNEKQLRDEIYKKLQSFQN